MSAEGRCPSQPEDEGASWLPDGGEDIPPWEDCLGAPDPRLERWLGAGELLQSENDSATCQYENMLQLDRFLCEQQGVQMQRHTCNE